MTKILSCYRCGADVPQDPARHNRARVCRACRRTSRLGERHAKRRAAIVAAVAATGDVRRVARRFRVSRQRIFQVLALEGAPPPRAEAVARGVAALRALPDGASAAEAARALGVTPDTVRAWAAAGGVRLRNCARGARPERAMSGLPDDVVERAASLVRAGRPIKFAAWEVGADYHALRIELIRRGAWTPPPGKRWRPDVTPEACAALRRDGLTIAAIARALATSGVTVRAALALAGMR